MYICVKFFMCFEWLWYDYNSIGVLSTVKEKRSNQYKFASFHDFLTSQKVVTFAWLPEN